MIKKYTQALQIANRKLKTLTLAFTSVLPNFNGLLIDWTADNEFRLRTGSSNTPKSKLTISYSNNACDASDLVAIDTWSLADNKSIQCKSILSENCIKTGLNGKMTTSDTDNIKVIEPFEDGKGCGYRVVKKGKLVGNGQRGQCHCLLNSNLYDLIDSRI